MSIIISSLLKLSNFIDSNKILKNQSSYIVNHNIVHNDNDELGGR